MSYQPSPATPIAVGIVLALVVIPVLAQVIPPLVSEIWKASQQVVEPKNEYWRGVDQTIRQPFTEWLSWILTNRDALNAILIVDAVVLLIVMLTLLRR